MFCTGINLNRQYRNVITFNSAHNSFHGESRNASFGILSIAFDPMNPSDILSRCHDGPQPRENDIGTVSGAALAELYR